MVKSATVSQESDGKYSISVLFAYDAPVMNHTIDTSNAMAWIMLLMVYIPTITAGRAVTISFIVKAMTNLRKNNVNFLVRPVVRKVLQSLTTIENSSSRSIRYTGTLQISV